MTALSRSGFSLYCDAAFVNRGSVSDAFMGGQLGPGSCNIAGLAHPELKNDPSAGLVCA
jgi:hypothetical protein